MGSGKKRIGLITWHYYRNFGSALQAYALQEVIRSMGHKVEIINYHSPKFGKTDSAKELAKGIACRVFGDRIGASYYAFQNQYFRQTRAVQEEKDLLRLSERFDAFICGSDQIWAPNVFNPVYMLDFVRGGKKKISYAASIGLNELPPNLIGEYTRLLSDFDSVSVREDAGAELLKKECGITARTVLDPTLLLDAETWQTLEKETAFEKSKYIFCYFLNARHGYAALVKEYAKKHGYAIVGVSADERDAERMELVRIGPREFLRLIHNAQAVFTDSYHGTIFSLLYRKRFVTFERFSDSDPLCQNSRIYQLDRYFGLNGRIVNAAETEEIGIKEADHAEFEAKRKELRIKSLDFLSSALEKE